MYYKSLYGEQNNQLTNKLFDVNKQIASRLTIQYAQDNVSVFAETMRLDNEITALGQIQKSTNSGLKVSDQSDEVLNEFVTSMKRMNTLLISSANDTNDATSRNAIAAELRGIESNLKSLANTSINGQYIFSGSAIDVKPISEDGTYNGNGFALNAFLGSRTQQQYNISGAELFLGEDPLSKKEVTTNVIQSPNVSGTVLSGNTTMSEFMGDTNAPNTHYFYLRGVQSDGTSFNQQIPMADTETIDNLLTKIGNAYGNSGSTKVVDVSMNSSGEIVIADKVKGSSKLDFNLVGATDFSGGVAANVTNIDNLDSGTTNYATASSGAGSLYVREFVKSSYGSAASGITNIDGLLYDRTQFSVSGNNVSSNMAQIVKGTNAFATPSTKISEVADLSQGTAGTLDGTQFKLSGTNTNGTAFNAQIDFKNTANGGSTFSLDGGVTNYTIFNMETPRVAVDADKMTYQQMMDVVNMVTTGQIPASTNIAANYDTAIASSNNIGKTSLSYDGKINFNDLNVTNTKAKIALYDSNSGDFSIGSNSSVMSFNSNNALTVRDPKTDFFKTIDMIISSVEEQKINPDSTQGDIRNVGIENAMAMLEDLQDHIFRSQSKVGAYSNTLTSSLERTAMLELSTKSLRSSVIDTDLAEASLSLAQLTTNYQAMLSTVSKVSQLSLVNYL
jgi:flagellar hook-associated protein 3 FlgL